MKARSIIAVVASLLLPSLAQAAEIKLLASSAIKFAYFELLPQLKAIPEALEHIEAQYGRIPFAVVSGSTRDSVRASLRTLNLLDRFDTLICAGDYLRSKPDPEAFLLGAAKLGVAPGDCLVFEDTEMGIQAATAAGMASIKIPPPWQRASASQKDVG